MRSWIPETGGGTDQTAAPNANEPVVALLPNPAGFNADDIYNLAAGDNPTTDDLGYDDPSGPGGANEDYDCPRLPKHAHGVAIARRTGPHPIALPTFFG